MPNVTRRRVLAGGLTIASGVLAGCGSTEEPDTFSYDTIEKEGTPPLADIDVKRGVIKVILERGNDVESILFKRYPQACNWWFEDAPEGKTVEFKHEFDTNDRWELTFMQSWLLREDNSDCWDLAPANVESAGRVVIELTLP